MSLRVLHVDLRTHPVRTRIPFRYGITTLTELPHLFVFLDAVIDGDEVTGISAEGLAPKWFTKDPETTVARDMEDMFSVVRNAAKTAQQLPPAKNVFKFWRTLYDSQKTWADARRFSPLLWNLGVSLVERALIHAWCRHRKSTFHLELVSGGLGFDPGAIHPELSRAKTTDLAENGLLPASPVDRILVRHTVGLADPLGPGSRTDGSEAEPVDKGDGLPLTLDEIVQAYGVSYFKIKISGESDFDRHRLAEIASGVGE